MRCVCPAGRARRYFEFKVNFLAPAAEEEFIARGKVMRSGHCISVCTGEVIALAQGSEKAVALMQATMTAVA
jgi:acyl-coenzyme A thioesterase PaaI-like protein